jgi:hypothetical protein
MRGRDATTVFSFFIVLLIAVPSRLIFGPLGAAGTPAQVLGMGALLWWSANWLARPHALTVIRTPIRTAMLVFSAACLTSYVIAATRPIDGVEIRSADRGLLTLCAWLGLLVVAADRISSRQRLDVLLRRLVAATGALASLGIVQFVTHKEWINYIQIPGLTLNADLSGVIGRAGFVRPSGTAIHPIEFGVVLTMVLPLALHFAFHDGHRSRLRRWTPPAAIALAVPLSISRSALLGAFIVLLLLLPTWSRPRRRQVYGLLLLLSGAVYVAVPGLLGTLQGLFLGISGDDSAKSRTDSYALVGEFFGRAPLFGRGIGTFLPSYRILDNQYLGTAIETGVAGLLALLALLVTGVVTGQRLRRASGDPMTRNLAQSLAASIAAGACSFATFDALSFPMVAGLMFLLLGCTAALHRLTIRDAATQDAHQQDAHEPLPAGGPVLQPV